jgi:hypothetical protein
MSAKKGTKVTTKIVKAKKVEVVWTRSDFERELEKAKRVGPKKTLDDDLVNFCHGANGYFRAHFWADARPFFQELWRRINHGEFQISKSEACRRIGCSRQWANAIVSGCAKAKQAKTGNKVSIPILTVEDDEDYVQKILNHAFAKLKPLLQSHRNSYRAICRELAKHFNKAWKTPPAGKARAAGAD